MQQNSRILISGASGFIGSALVPYLEALGHEVFRLVRDSSDSPAEIPWKPGSRLDPAILPESLDVVINLSGSSIAVPFSARNRELILKSRLDSTNTLVEAILEMPRPPALLLNASGSGYYGSSQTDEEFTEDSPAGDDFVAQVCVEWEACLDSLAGTQTRSVALRTGIVLGADGGALQKMLPAFRMGLGAVLGSGRQYMSWISLRDYLRSVDFIIQTPGLRGPVNLTAPDPVTNAEFSRKLASALRKPLALRAPAFALKLAMGEMAELLLLGGQRVLPRQLQSAGFNWSDADLDSTLQGFFQGS